jgi:serine/threonine-protein kinase
MNSTSGPVDVLGLVGSKIDQVRFDACVDAGGFGLIYRGYHEGLGETVAIKCLRIASIQKTNEAMREALAGRFRDETKLLYRLSQGSLDIVRCIGSGSLVAPKTNEYTPYMVLEWLDGCTLSVELKERRAQKQRPRTLEAAVQLLDSAVGGIAYAHLHDVVHRDVKPGNLFLTRTREGVRMKVLDFGLAKILSDESIGVRPSVETGVGVHFCSPSYGAPEQFNSKLGKIGPWTDVYSLALVLLEILTGDKVRPSVNLAEGLLKAVDPKTGSPSARSLGLQLPRAVEVLLLSAVAQNPLDRPRDAGVFWSALKEAIAAAPKPNLNMATVMDDAVGEAMQQVRSAARMSSAPPKGGPPGGSPFAGTMLMQNAPTGAPHLAPPPAAAGTKPTAAVLKGTLPIGAMSPLAASSTDPVLSPLRNMPPPAAGGAAGSVPPPYGAGAQGHAPPAPGQTPQRVGHPQQASMQPHPPQQASMQPHPPQQASMQPHPQQRSMEQQPMPSGRPPPPSAGGRGSSGKAPAATTSSGGIVFLVLCVVLAAVGITFYWVRMR